LVQLAIIPSPDSHSGEGENGEPPPLAGMRVVFSMQVFALQLKSGR
jgi:hypothetical protein